MATKGGRQDAERLAAALDRAIGDFNETASNLAAAIGTLPDNTDAGTREFLESIVRRLKGAAAGLTIERRLPDEAAVRSWSFIGKRSSIAAVTISATFLTGGIQEAGADAWHLTRHTATAAIQSAQHLVDVISGGSDVAPVEPDDQEPEAPSEPAPPDDLPPKEEQPRSTPEPAPPGATRTVPGFELLRHDGLAFIPADERSKPWRTKRAHVIPGETYLKPGKEEDAADLGESAVERDAPD